LPAVLAGAPVVFWPEDLLLPEQPDDSAAAATKNASASQVKDRMKTSR
jgi:hypothetical protein